MAGHRSVRLKGLFGIMHKHDGPGLMYGLQKKRITRSSSQRGRAGMIQALVDANYCGAGLMGGGDELGEDGPIQDCSELVLACRITRHDRQERADRYRGTVAKPDVVASPVKRGKSGGRGSLNCCSEKRREQPDGQGLQQFGGHEKPPESWPFEQHLY